MSSTGRRAACATALAGLVLFLPGCAAPSPEAHAGIEGAPVPVPGGTLRLFMEAPASLDPLDVESVYESIPVNQIFDPLVATDTTLSVVPGLAEDWTISPDGKVYTFRLRTDARFSDGSAVEAEDVVFSFRRALDPRGHRVSMAAAYLDVVEGAPSFRTGRTGELRGIRAIDSKTVEIRLARPYVSFLGVLALDNLRIVPRRIVSGPRGDRFARAPIGSGPFHLESWTPQGLRLVANPSYWGNPPHLDAVEIRFPDPDRPDLAAELMARGEIDLIEATAEALEALSGRPGIVTYRYPELAGAFLGLSAAHSPTKDVRVRRAIAHAIDRDAMAAISPTTRRPATGILPPGMPGYSPKPKALAHDPDRARELLAEAGFPAGEGLRPLVLYTARGSQITRTTALRIREDLAAVGIRVEIREVPWPELSRRISDNDAPSFLLGWVADLVDPDAFIRTLFEPDASTNYFAFRDEEVGARLRLASIELNPIERARMYRELECLILEAAPVVPLYQPRAVVLHRDGVHGVEPGPLGVATLDFERVWKAANRGDGS